MRGGILALGIIIVILGIFLYFTGNNMIKEVEAYDVEGIPISEVLKLVSENARRQYEMGQSMVMFGTIFGIVGFILSIAGIVAPGIKPITNPKLIIQKCERCGREVKLSDMTVFNVEKMKLKVCKNCENEILNGMPVVLSNKEGS